MDSFDEQLRKNSEFIVNLLSSKVLESEQRILNKIDQEVVTIKQSIAAIDERVQKLEENQSSLMLLRSEVEQLKKLAEVQENKAIAADALLYGVPLLPNENLKSLFNSLCQTLAVQTPVLKTIYRTALRTTRIIHQL